MCRTVIGATSGEPKLHQRRKFCAGFGTAGIASPQASIWQPCTPPQGCPPDSRTYGRAGAVARQAGERRGLFAGDRQRRHRPGPGHTSGDTFELLTAARKTSQALQRPPRLCHSEPRWNTWDLRPQPQMSGCRTAAHLQVVGGSGCFGALLRMVPCMDRRTLFA